MKRYRRNMFGHLEWSIQHRLWAAIMATWALLLISPAQATTVRLVTVKGPIDIALYDTEAPLTVTNFLSYVNAGAYTSSFFHRSVPGFVIQGGGFVWDDGSGYRSVTTSPAVKNEFSATRSNLRGTIAMAKLGGDPDSATSQWFFNLGNNAANLDNQNGGFTVFGKVHSPGMAVVDALAALKIVNANGTNTSGPFGALPITSLPASGPLMKNHLAMIERASVLPVGDGVNESDRIFNYLEATYPQFLAVQPTAATASGNALGYYYRYYPSANAYIGTSQGTVYYLVPSISNEITAAGSVAEFLALAKAAGY